MANPTNSNVVFGSFELPLVEEVSRPRTAKGRQSDAPGLARKFGGGSLADARVVTIRGIKKFGAGVTRTQAIGALSAALPEGMLAQLFINDATQYLMAEAYTLDCDEKSDLIGAVPYDAVFEVHDPFYWDVATNTVNFAGSSSGGGNIAYTGTAPARPVVTVSVASLPSTAGVGYIDVLNARQGGTGFRLYPTAVGDIIVDGYAEAVTRGGVDAMAELRGVYLELQPAAAGGSNVNAITVAVGGGLTATNIRVTYQNRYR